MINRPLTALYAGNNFAVGGRTSSIEGRFSFGARARLDPKASQPLILASKTSHEEASRMPLLRPSPYCCPLREGLQAITVFPRKLKELPRIQVAGFFAKKCFEPPLKIRAPPGLQTVAARGDPVVSQRCPHENRDETGLRILRARPIRRAAPTDAHAPRPTTCRAFPKYLCSGPPRRCFSRLSSSP